jgi:hypothetical protein
MSRLHVVAGALYQSAYHRCRVSTELGRADRGLAQRPAGRRGASESRTAAAAAARRRRDVSSAISQHRDKQQAPIDDESD